MDTLTTMLEGAVTVLSPVLIGLGVLGLGVSIVARLRARSLEEASEQEAGPGTDDR